MDLALKLARAYWRTNVQAWVAVRRYAPQILITFGVASVGIWAVGVARNSDAMQWAPAIYAWTLLFAYGLSRYA